jgi:phosphoenolpyruvate carboxylase
MYPSKSTEKFEKLVKKKFDIYNSLFLNLPYNKEKNVGSLIPLLHDYSKKGLKNGEHPQKILDKFFKKYAYIENEEEKIDFMFRVVQYVERQVVLFDSVEDAAFKATKDLGDDLSIKDFFQIVENKGDVNDISKQLSSFSARIVFTAHPTQFYPPNVLDIITRLRPLVEKNNINEIDQTLQQLGLTSLINTEKPTPLDEARNIIYYLRTIYYDAVGKMYASVKEWIRDKTFDNPNIIKFGFWPGGDRDGNPYVTSEITMDVADELRMTLMKCYYEDVKNLQKKLTFRGIEEILEELKNNLYNCMFSSEKFLSYDEIINPLHQVKKLLKKNYYYLYKKELDLLIDKVRIFKTHFASLDIRQDHRMHKKVIEAILKKENIIKESVDELNKEELIDVLLHKKLLADSQQFEEGIVKDTINNIYQLKTIQRKNGEDGCNRYIISNSEDIFSVLFVYALFRWCGWGNQEITFDIIPLFETLAGMKASEACMQELFELEDYRAHVGKRDNRQTIMLGFSDGTKDAGYMKANWAIFETKERLSILCKKYDIEAIFFDGRGGPPSRGGGKTHRFYASQSDVIANKEIQLTIQGQTITSKYGSEEQFTHHCEQLLTAGLSRNIFPKGNDISPSARKIIEDLANISYEKYAALKAHEKFLPYLENRSPLKYYAQAKVASRPGKRGGSKKLEFSDLRAISFVGAWSQLKQNVPGYFGIGAAIKKLIDDGRWEELKKAYDETAIFRALILNSTMSLYKSKFRLTSYMAEDEEFKDFWNILHDEFQLSKEMMLRLSGNKVLMEEEPVSRESIKIREKIVLPLLVIQQYALQKVIQGADKKEVYEKIVTRSLYGNINASRNSV